LTRDTPYRRRNTNRGRGVSAAAAARCAV